MLSTTPESGKLPRSSILHCADVDTGPTSLPRRCCCCSGFPGGAPGGEPTLAPFPFPAAKALDLGAMSILFENTSHESYTPQYLITSRSPNHMTAERLPIIAQCHSFIRMPMQSALHHT